MVYLYNFFYCSDYYLCGHQAYPYTSTRVEAISSGDAISIPTDLVLEKNEILKTINILNIARIISKKTG